MDSHCPVTLLPCSVPLALHPYFPAASSGSARTWIKLRMGFSKASSRGVPLGVFGACDTEEMWAPA